MIKGLGQDKPEAWVIKGQPWGWEASVCIYLVAVLIDLRPFPFLGQRGEWSEGQRSLESCQSGRSGAELGEELTCFRPGNEWAPVRGLPGWKVGQGDSSAPPSGVEGIWTLVFGSPGTVVAIEIGKAPPFFPKKESWPIPCCWCLGGQGVGGASLVVAPRLCL